MGLFKYRYQFITVMGEKVESIQFRGQVAPGSNLDKGPRPFTVLNSEMDQSYMIFWI